MTMMEWLSTYAIAQLSKIKNSRKTEVKIFPCLYFTKGFSPEHLLLIESDINVTLCVLRFE